MYTTADSNAHIKGDVTGNVKGNVTGNVNGNVTGNVTGNINGEITATKLTLNSGVTIPASKISGLSTSIANTISSEYLKLGTKYNSSTNSILISSKGELNVTGASIDGMIHGLLTGEFSGKATITDGTIGSCNITNGILNIPAGLITFNQNSRCIHGTKGEVDLFNGTFNFGSGNFVFTNNSDKDHGVVFKIRPTGKDSSLLYLDNTDTLYLMKTVNSNNFITSISPASLNISDGNNALSLSVNAISFTKNNMCSITFDGNNLKLDNPVFLDHYEKDQPESNNYYRRPISSVNTEGLRVGFLRANTLSGKKCLQVKGEWGDDDGDGNYIGKNAEWATKKIIIDGESDIRLKKNIKNSSVNALQVVLNMPVREFDWKESKIHQPLGLVADEIEPLDPLLTIGGGYNSDGSMDVKNIDRLLLTEYAIKAIQEQQEIINKQQKEINVLKQTLNIN